MRKIDYATLADIFKRQRSAAYQAAANERSRGHDGAFHEGKAAAIELAAECFARESNVNRVEFLKACGIEP